ncbi:hypothetical protein NCCP691_40600 [Noviherbaspirillum aridicola]|uniref:Excisionase family DNA binding protein n=1 Tax=Noviherbaspirillum aridicola TaxID=2849687 RepID=A0ABQ4Q9Y4_9BURK|nr:hypothetical protein NCCP691_40600 [Noviherbaspirillum aridicola]
MATFMTKADVAGMLHCSIRHVERLMREGLPFIPIGGRKKLFCAESIMRWLMMRESCIPKRAITTGAPRPAVAAPNAYLEYVAEKADKREARMRRDRKPK